MATAERRFSASSSTMASTLPATASNRRYTSGSVISCWACFAEGHLEKTRFFYTFDTNFFTHKHNYSFQPKRRGKTGCCVLKLVQ
ncbi:hypothetical protein TYRP_021710 [Tyrophagus putrescentiae]|nr:hypothetical protein TYRP_021710 [Tyrophagus putrescentiae]